MRFIKDTDSLTIEYESQQEFDDIEKYLRSKMNGEQFWTWDKVNHAFLIPTRYNFSTRQILDGIKIVQLQERAERAEGIVRDIWKMFYGQGFEVAFWHQNGDLEAMDNFFEENDWEVPDAPKGQMVET